MHDNIALSRLPCKRNGATAKKCHSLAMGSGKKQPKTELQRLFVERLTEEMDARGISDNALAIAAKRAGHKLSQTMVSGIKRFERDPTIGKVHAIAETLGVPAWFLLTPKDRVEQTVIRPPSNVVRLPDPYPKIFGKKPETPATKKTKRRS